MFELNESTSIEGVKMKSFNKIILVINYNSACQSYLEIFSKLQQMKPEFVYVACNIDSNEQFVQQYQIKQVPSVLILPNPALIDPSLHQAQPLEILEIAENLIPEFNQRFEKEKEYQLQKIGKILSDNKVFLVIKGSVENPYCKFTKKLLAMIKPFNFKFGFYDIRADRPQADWFKMYSQWPTFPQVYINKKVLGGGDTVEKLINENKFKDVIPKDCFIRRLDTLKSEYKYLVLTNGKHTQLQEFMNSKSIQCNVYNYDLDVNLKEELKQMQNELQDSYLVYEDKLYTLDEIKQKWQ